MLISPLNARHHFYHVTATKQQTFAPGNDTVIKPCSYPHCGL